MLAPLVLRSNELVLQDRTRLVELSKSKEDGNKLSAEDEAWLPRLLAERAKLRENGTVVTGNALAPTLDRYSERGDEYVKSLQAIIRVNNLAPADSTYLRDMKPVYLVPVGEQSDECF